MGEYKSRPTAVYDWVDFVDIITNLGWEKAKTFFEGEWKKMAVSVGWTWGGSQLHLTNVYGDEFTFIITYEGTLTIWNLTSTHIATVILKDKEDEELKKALGSAVIRTEEYTHGYVHCCDETCGKKINYMDALTRRYFAGVYCVDCWNRKWKAVEAKEHYD